MSLDFVARGFVQSLLALTVVSLAASLIVAWAWRRQETSEAHPAWLARRLFAMRIFPGAVALVVALVGVPFSYWLWEPRGDYERVGPIALLLAAMGGIIVLSSLVRVARSFWQSRVVERRLIEAAEESVPGLDVPAERIDSPFPIVALVGVLRPRLFVAATVLDSCTRQELQTVIAHEMAHARTLDNLRRLLLVAVPDPLAWLPIGRQMVRDWAAAAELAADEGAVDGDPQKRVHLAAALVKVARLAATTRPVPLPASALYRGEEIADRVRRLVGTPGTPAASRRTCWPYAVMAGLLAVMPFGLGLLHDALEAAIAFGR